MRNYSAIDSNIKKRKIKTISESTSPSTLYKSNININLLNSMRLTKKNNKKNQIKIKNKSVGFDSINNTSNQKLLTPQNNLKIKKLSNSKNKPEKFDNNAVFTSIISKIENIMNNYKQDIVKLYNILANIENFINSVVIEDESFRKTKNGKNDNITILSLKGKIINYNLESIEEIKKNKGIPPPINDSNINKNNLSSNNILEGEQSELECHIYKRKINKLILKINEMENKFKLEKLSYLFYIGEYQKKVAELEKKLNLNSIDNMPKTEIKKLLCYPHYVKFDVNEDINPKSIPMFNLRKKKCQSSIHDFRRNKKIQLSKSDFGINSSINNDLKPKDNNINVNSCIDLSDEIKSNNIVINEKLKNNEEEKFNEKEEEMNFNDLDKIKIDSQILRIDKLFGKNKNFFLSHPKLAYIKSLKDGNKLASWKLENQINSLPKELSKLKTLSKTQKNAIVVFPSFLNETMVNLEKLRTNKNFRSIENKFEETFKLKIKNDF